MTKTFKRTVNLTFKKTTVGNLKTRAAAEALPWSPVLSHWIDRCEITARNGRNSPYSEDKVKQGLKTKVEAKRIQSNVFRLHSGPLSKQPPRTFLKEQFRRQRIRGARNWTFLKSCNVRSFISLKDIRNINSQDVAR